MKRREIVLGLSALAGMPAALSFAGNAIAQSVDPYAGSAAKRGVVIELPPTMIRLNMLAMSFANSAAAVDIDALFDVDGQLLPYRIATFRAGAVSPQSKMLGFSVDQRALAGFRVELCRAGRSMTAGLNGGACMAGVESPLRSTLAGKFVLDIDSTGISAVVSPVKETQNFDDPAWLSARRNQSFMAFDLVQVPTE